MDTVPLYTVPLTKVWRYDAGDDTPLVIRTEPNIDGPRTEYGLNPGAIFTVSQELRGEEDGVLYLKLEDGTGWVFDQKPGFGTICKRYSEGDIAHWRYSANEERRLIIRKVPDIDGVCTENYLEPGEVFAVSQELEGSGGVKYLKLADGRGWAFDRKPGVGVLCQPYGNPDAKPLPWRYNPQDDMPIFIREGPDINAPRRQEAIYPGDTFYVSEERRGRDGVLYLALADGHGWLFDSKPGVGRLCERLVPN